MAHVVSSGGNCTSQMPKPEIITPDPCNGALAELQAMKGTRSAPNTSQLIGDCREPVITQWFHKKINNKPSSEVQNQHKAT